MRRGTWPKCYNNTVREGGDVHGLRHSNGRLEVGGCATHAREAEELYEAEEANELKKPRELGEARDFADQRRDPLVPVHASKRYLQPGDILGVGCVRQGGDHVG